MYHGVARYYLCEHHAVKALCSNDMMHLHELKIKGKTYGTPHEWNEMPLFIRKYLSLNF